LLSKTEGVKIRYLDLLTTANGKERGKVKGENGERRRRQTERAREDNSGGRAKSTSERDPSTLKPKNNADRGGAVAHECPIFHSYWGTHRWKKGLTPS
jgi:hypothetical protein